MPTLPNQISTANTPGLLPAGTLPLLGVPGQMQNPNAMPTAASANAYQAQPVANMGTLEAQLGSEQQRRKMAEALMQTGYIQNSGGAGVLAQLGSAWLGRKAADRSDKKISELAREAFDAKNADDRQKTAIARQQKLEDEARQAEAAKDLKRSPGWEGAPTSAREYGLAKDDPAYAQFLERDRQSRGTNVTVNSGPSGPQVTKFQGALGDAQAGQYIKWQEDSVTATEAKQKIAALRQITALQKTGKLQEAQALVGQYFGTQAGSNMQAFNAMTGPMVIDLAKNLKPLSNSDIAFVEKSMPRFGNDPRANAQILDLLDGAADRQISLYDQAAQFAEKNRSLDGFRPSYAPRQGAPGGGAGGPPVRYHLGQTIVHGGKKYRVAGGDLSNDPDLEEIR